MVNLIAERDVVPELVQTDFTAPRVCVELRRIIPDSEARETMIAAFRDLPTQRLRPGDHAVSASERAAKTVLALMDQQR